MQKLFENWRGYQKQLLNESPPSIETDYIEHAAGDGGRADPRLLPFYQEVDELKDCLKGGCPHRIEFSGDTPPKPSGPRRTTLGGAEFPHGEKINKVWNYDPRELSFEQWLEKHGFEHIPAQEAVAGYTMTPEEFYQEKGYHLPDFEDVVWGTGGGPDYSYLEVPPRPAVPERWRGPNRRYILGLPGLHRVPATGAPESLVAKWEPKASGVYSGEQYLRELHKEEGMLYNWVLKDKMATLKREIVVAKRRRHDITTGHAPEGRPSAARTTFHASEEKALLKELNKFIPSPEEGGIAAEFGRLKVEMHDRGMRVAHLTNQDLAWLLADDYIKRNPDIEKIIDPSSGYRWPVLDSELLDPELTSRALRDEMNRVTDHWTRPGPESWRPGKPGEIPRTGQSIVEVPGRTRADNLIYWAGISPKGPDLMWKWSAYKDYEQLLKSNPTEYFELHQQRPLATDPTAGRARIQLLNRRNRERIDKELYRLRRKQERLMGEIEDLADANLERSKKGKPPKGVRKSKYKPEPGVVYDRKERIERLAEHLDARHETEVLVHRMKIGEISPGDTAVGAHLGGTADDLKREFAKLDDDINRMKLSGASDEVVEAAAGKGLKKLPIIGRIFVAGFLTGEAIKAYMKGYHGSKPGAEGVMSFVTDVDSKEGMPYQTATMIPILGELLDTIDITSALPTHEQSTEAMIASVQRAHDMPPVGSREWFKRKAMEKESEADIDAAFDMCEQSGMVPHPADMRHKSFKGQKVKGWRHSVRCVTSEQAEKIEQRMERLNRLRENKKPIKKINIIIG
tara:strand:- start:4 stop:2391 length:2388 start_codon:yes stop_codon:yes gene_type:complete